MFFATSPNEKASDSATCGALLSCFSSNPPYSLVVGVLSILEEGLQGDNELVQLEKEAVSESESERDLWELKLGGLLGWLGLIADEVDIYSELVVDELHTGLLAITLFVYRVELFEFVAALLALGYFELLDVIKVVPDRLKDLIEGYATD
jgi:hypothetical protein